MIGGANDARAMGGHGVGSPEKQVQTPRRRAPTLVALSSCGGPVTARCRPPLGTETLRAARADLPAQGLEPTITSNPHWPQGISCCGYSLHVLSGVVSTPSCPPRFSGRPILRSNPHPIQLASDLCGIIPMSAAGDRVTVLPTAFAASSVVRRVSAPAAAAAERSVPGTSPDGHGGDSTGGTIEVKFSSKNLFRSCACGHRQAVAPNCIRPGPTSSEAGQDHVPSGGRRSEISTIQRHVSRWPKHERSWSWRPTLNLSLAACDAPHLPSVGRRRTTLHPRHLRGRSQIWPSRACDLPSPGAKRCRQRLPQRRQACSLMKRKQARSGRLPARMPLARLGAVGRAGGLWSRSCHPWSIWWGGTTVGAEGAIRRRPVHPFRQRRLVGFKLVPPHVRPHLI